MNSYVKIMAMLFVLIPAFAIAGTSGPAPIPAAPNFQISTTLTTLCRGMINNVPVKISNPPGGAGMQNVQLAIVGSKTAYSVGNGTVSVVNVTANSV